MASLSPDRRHYNFLRRQPPPSAGPVGSLEPRRTAIALRKAYVGVVIFHSLSMKRGLRNEKLSLCRVWLSMRAGSSANSGKEEQPFGQRFSFAAGRKSPAEVLPGRRKNCQFGHWVDVRLLPKTIQGFGQVPWIKCNADGRHGLDSGCPERRLPSGLTSQNQD